MGRKRKKDAAAVERPIFCFYCDRVFADETTLITHQKGKHFKCTECNKRLNSVGGMTIHLFQVHRVEVKEIPNAKEGRGALEWEIFGMAGVPEGMMPGGPIPTGENLEAKVPRLEEGGAAAAPMQQPGPPQGYPPPGAYGAPPASAPYGSGMPPPYMMMPQTMGGYASPPGYRMHPHHLHMPPPFAFRPGMPPGLRPPPGFPRPGAPGAAPPLPHGGGSHQAHPPASAAPNEPVSNGAALDGGQQTPLQHHQYHHQAPAGAGGPLFPIADPARPEAAAPGVSEGVREDQQAAPAEPTLIWTDEQFSMVRALNTAAHTRRCPQCGRDCRQDEGDPGGVMQEERRAQLLASQTTASRQAEYSAAAALRAPHQLPPHRY